jgi:phage anti-repressor protein
LQSLHLPFSSLDVIAQSINQYPVDFDDAWQWVGYARKDIALRTLQENFEEGTDFCLSGMISKAARDNNLISRNKVENQVSDSSHGGKRNGAGRKVAVYLLTVDCFKAFCMMAGTEKSKEVRRYFLDVGKR